MSSTLMKVAFIMFACALATTVAIGLKKAEVTEETAFVETQAKTQAKAQAGAQWRFGSNYVPQHYGNWQFQKGNWNFGNDRRIECEACGYVMYMLIDRLGDEFNHQTVTTEMGNLCPRVQWVFRSGCEYITKKHGPKIINAVMRLTEPEDICKQLSYCSPSFYDAALHGAGGPYGGMGGMMGPGMMAPGMMPGMNVGGNPMVFHAGGMGPGVPPMGYGATNPNLNVPGQGYNGNVYPTPGSHPMAAQHPYSPYSFGGYDPYGYPYPHPGVPSSTPPPPSSGEGGEAKL